MLFNTASYFAFLLVVAAAYWAIPRHSLREKWLLAASWLFYAAWHPVYLALFVGVSVGNFLLAKRIAATRGHSSRTLKLGIALNLLVLGYYKYTNFFLDIASTALPSGSSIVLEIFLPLGISFYIFQMVAYLVDVSRGNATPERSFFRFALFIAFFPQLIAGPIVRAKDLLPQLASKRAFSADKFCKGLDLIARGLFKKVVIADTISTFVTTAYEQPSDLGSLTSWLVVYAYSIQIYCDFSGYTDIGRGSAYVLGIELPENFARPYLAGNIAEFWRRWHMTLSLWLRDYLYVPLGGNRHGEFRTYRNLMLTMLLGGLWHGASWNFVVWGALHGGALAVHRLWSRDRRGHGNVGVARQAVHVLLNFHFVSVVWIFFRASDFSAAWSVLSALVNPSLVTATDKIRFGYVELGIVAASVAVLFTMHGAGKLLGDVAPRWHHRLRGVGYACVLIAVTLFAGHGNEQFIYFQF